MLELYRSDRLLVRMHAPHRSTRLVITFAPWRREPSVDGPGFGAGFCDDHGLDAVHVTCAGNDWYQYAEMPDVYAAIRAAGRDYGTLVTYGVSMGGYQAIRAAPHIGARRILAVSPQVSVDPAKAPFERRWPAAMTIDFLDDALIAEPGARYALVYDPRSAPDAGHARRIAAGLVANKATRAHVQPVLMPFAGHFVLEAWKEAGILSKATLTLLKSKKDTGGVRALFRRQRWRSTPYLERLLASGRLSGEMAASVAARLAALRSERAPPWSGGNLGAR